MIFRYLPTCCVGTILAVSMGSAVYSANILLDIPGPKRDITAKAQEGAARRRRETTLYSDHPLLVMLNISAPWHRHLRFVIATTEDLGRLIVGSTDAHFDLKPAVIAGRGLLVHTGFRPSMVQITNEAWRTFRAVRDNTMRLKMSVARVPEAIKQALAVLGVGNTTEIFKALQAPEKAINDSIREGSENARSIEKEITQLFQFASETSDRLVTEMDELKASLNAQFSSIEHRNKLLGLLSTVQMARTSVTSLKSKLTELTKLFEIVKGVVGSILQQASRSFIEVVQRVSRSPEIISDDPTQLVHDLLMSDARRIAAVSIFMRTVAEVHLYVSDRYVLAPERLIVFSALQHPAKSQAGAKLQQLIYDNKAAWIAIESLVEQKRQGYRQETLKYGHEIETILNQLRTKTE